MKKLFIPFLAFALAFAGCAKDPVVDPDTDDPVEVEDAVIFSGTTDLGGTPVGDPVKWTQSDVIGIFFMTDDATYGTPVNAKYTAQNSAMTSAFTNVTTNDVIKYKLIEGEQPDAGAAFFAYYPHSSSANDYKLDAASLTLKIKTGIPATHTHGTAGAQKFMIGKDTAPTADESGKVSADMKFMNLFATLNLQLKGTGTIKTMTIEGADLGYLSGWVDIDKFEPMPDPANPYTAANLISTGIFTPETGIQPHSKITVNFGEGLALSETEAVEVPVGVFPFAVPSTGLKLAFVDVYDNDMGEYTVLNASGDSGREIKSNHTVDIALSGIEGQELTLPVGTVLLNENFDWIAPLWPTGNIDNQGWPTTGGADLRWDNAPDELKALANEKGYAFTLYVYYRADADNGYIKTGRTDDSGGVMLPALAGLTVAPHKLKVTLDAAVYSNEGGTTLDEDKTLKIHVLDSEGEILSTRTQTISGINNHFAWKRFWVILDGVTSANKIMINDEHSTSTAGANRNRIFFDNVKVEVASANATAGSEEIANPADIFIEDENPEILGSANSSTIASIRARGKWSAQVTSGSDWLTIGALPTSATSGNARFGNLTLTAISENPSTTTPRTAQIAVTSSSMSGNAADAKTKTFTVSQLGSSVAATFDGVIYRETVSEGEATISANVLLQSWNDWYKTGPGSATVTYSHGASSDANNRIDIRTSAMVPAGAYPYYSRGGNVYTGASAYAGSTFIINDMSINNLDGPYTPASVVFSMGTNMSATCERTSTIDPETLASTSTPYSGTTVTFYFKRNTDADWTAVPFPTRGDEATYQCIGGGNAGTYKRVVFDPIQLNGATSISFKAVAHAYQAGRMDDFMLVDPAIFDVGTFANY